ncbi:MAG: Lsr2 family protein [Intrasporangium sp.]|uniref:histone-like nucleoid-structuring protein Lsr2 n=1 Tax=Intrasporangium sp. TaxID=1925024 RepID=UPI002647A39A|nr:Lsr2 family protein [Intrasporangium sp.]MDN5795445.1 Lsr2 family protein [Intrasporangium sp.]
MAQRVEVILVDDLDGGDAAETVTFGLDGVTYEIDLSDANARKLRDALATWAGHARRTGGTKRTGGRRASRRNDVSAVREWARASGYTVSDRGRISAEIQNAYDKAH